MPPLHRRLNKTSFWAIAKNLLLFLQAVPSLRSGWQPSHSSWTELTQIKADSSLRSEWQIGIMLHYVNGMVTLPILCYRSEWPLERICHPEQREVSALRQTEKTMLPLHRRLNKMSFWAIAKNLLLFLQAVPSLRSGWQPSHSSWTELTQIKADSSLRSEWQIESCFIMPTEWWHYRFFAIARNDLLSVSVILSNAKDLL